MASLQINQKSYTQGPFQGQPVILVSNRTDESIETGSRWPCLITSEKASSVQLLFDSKDRINPNDDPFRFTVDLTTNLYRARSIQCTKAIIPKIPNVTVFNNQLQIKHDLGTTSVFSLQPAFYNTNSLANALTAAINAALAAASIADTVTTSFNSVTRTFSISSTGGNNFFITSESSFIQRGKFLANFQSKPLADTPTASIIYSGPAALVYTRYITVHSPTLNQYSYSNSLTTSFQQESNIVCILDISNIDDAEDYDPTRAFSGIYKSIDTPDAPQISVLNGQKNFHNIHSFYTLDEYGSPLQSIMNLGDPYPTNELGITMYFKARF